MDFHNNMRAAQIASSRFIVGLLIFLCKALCVNDPLISSHYLSEKEQDAGLL